MIAIAPLSALASMTATPASSRASNPSSANFGDLMGHAIASLAAQQSQAETAVTQALSGQGSITQAMTAVSQSQTSLDVATSIRNAVVQAGDSLMNLQI